MNNKESRVGNSEVALGTNATSQFPTHGFSLPSSFLPNVHYLARVVSGNCTIYTGEKYDKQTLRNRTILATARGVEHFTLPVCKVGFPYPPTSEVRISEHGDWRNKLSQLLLSAYKSSPYWFHYGQRIESLIHDRTTDRLVEYNHLWLAMLCDAWNIQLPGLSDQLEGDLCLELLEPSHYPENPRYWQVFEQKHGFFPHLSSLDLLLNLGPEGKLYLRDL